MFKILLTLCIIAIAAASPINKIDNDVKVEFLMVDDIEEYKKAHPFNELTPLSIDTIEPFAVIRHSAGGRVAGDRLVASGNGGQSWASPQDVQLTLQYPKSGTGAVVSYIEIVVDQSSNLGEGFIVDGGIGQRRITVVVQARSTTHFNFAYAIYGV